MSALKLHTTEVFGRVADACLQLFGGYGYMAEYPISRFWTDARVLRIYGGNSFEHKKPHRIGIDTLRAELDAHDAETWMVGDSYVDVQTARNAGVGACGVAWGFQPETFLEFPPDVLVADLGEFADRFAR